MVKSLRWFSTLLSTCLFVLVVTSCFTATSAEDEISSGGVVDAERVRRSPVNAAEGDFASRDKKIPRGFLGMRGKKGAPSGFLGLRGRRDDLGNDPSSTSLSPSSPGALQDDFPSTVEEEYGPQEKRAYYTYRGKKLPSGFMGLRGKKAPNGFMGLRGKKAPSYFMGLRGKKNDPEGDSPSYDDLSSLLDAMNNRYRNHYLSKAELEKRAHRGFMGLRGKKSEAMNDVMDYDTNEVTYGNPLMEFSPLYQRLQGYDKRSPRGFLGMRG